MCIVHARVLSHLISGLVITYTAPCAVISAQDTRLRVRESHQSNCFDGLIAEWLLKMTTPSVIITGVILIAHTCAPIVCEYRFNFVFKIPLTFVLANFFFYNPWCHTKFLKIHHMNNITTVIKNFDIIKMSCSCNTFYCLQNGLCFAIDLSGIKFFID